MQDIAASICGFSNRHTRFHRAHGYRIDDAAPPMLGSDRISLSNMTFLNAGGAFTDQALLIGVT